MKKRKGRVCNRKIKHSTWFSLAGMCHMAIPIKKAAWEIKFLTEYILTSNKTEVLFC